MNLIVISCFKNISSLRGLDLFMLSKRKTKIRKAEHKKFTAPSLHDVTRAL